MGLLLPGAPVLAQGSLPTGDGIKGDYYEGTDFEKYVLTRRDATINFNWGQQPPAPGLPAEQFSVRWTGWLVPPASGKYVFHVTVDDGIRLRLNNRLILNEWRGQPLSNYTATVELRAGEPYDLQVDYCQYGMDTRVFVTWELPDSPSNPPPSSWRNLWGLAADEPAPVPISSAYLFRENPRQAAKPASLSPAPTPQAPTGRKPQPPTQPPAKKRAAVAEAPPSRAAAGATATRRLAPVVARTPPPILPPPDSSRPAQLARLAVGESVTLSELYFEQGQARLLPPTRAALDQLALVLNARPSLRLEVQGHTDNVGNAELNRQLSQQRAEAVCLYLTAHGVGTAQLRPMGYGGTQPVADNADPAQRPRNRRVVLRRR